MSPTYPNDLTQEVDRRWQRRTKDDSTSSPHNNVAGGGPCPSCNKPSPIAPIVSEYRSADAIYHHWRCQSCGHEWMTQAMNA